MAIRDGLGRSAGYSHETDSFADHGQTQATPPGLAVPSRSEVTVCITTSNRFREMGARIENFQLGVEGLVRRLQGALPGDNAAKIGRAETDVPTPVQSGLSEMDQAHSQAMQAVEGLENALKQLHELNLA